MEQKGMLRMKRNDEYIFRYFNRNWFTQIFQKTVTFAVGALTSQTTS
jgi:hypothetical protein